MRSVGSLLLIALCGGLIWLGCSAGRVRADECPRVDLKEGAEDCPWASISRSMAVETEAGRSVGDVLRRELPGLDRDLGVDAARPGLLGLWGKSINFDEGAKEIIVPPEVLDYFAQRLGVAPRVDRIVHAGMEHTYGYLFSNLLTPFGYKRARWVRDDIEAGLGLRRGTLGPRPSEGTLLGNVTYFLARIAGVPVQAEGTIASELLTYDYGKLTGDRLVELVSSRPTQLVTDLVTFRHGSEGRQNTRLLVYSVIDSRRGAGAKLITAFPVEESFATRTLDPANLGEGLPVITRYNASVEGITGANPPLTGSRRTYAYRPRRLQGHPSP